uniref:Hemoglobin beta chain n=1 Tax=Gadus morhua TaxID=8049 RepID=B3F9U9_GADMO|nr:hemoglobin beta chain [Gadus morhua]ABV21573.1 hemoglobin beta chain [Gadus morhua]
MVEWTDSERAIITSIFSNLDYEEIGRKSLCRYFGGFGNLYNAETILCNPLIAAHGTKILHGLDRALKNMDDIKNTYAELSLLHSDKLHVDPDNFRLLADCLTVVIAAKMGPAFTVDTQVAWQKFLSVVVSALGRQYH